MHLPAQAFVVDAANGPGSNFTNLATAIATVPDGAVLRVRAGNYGGFTIASKSLTILGEPGATLTNLLLGPTIENLQAHQSVWIRGFDLQSFFSGAGVIRLTCRNNLGAVHLTELGVLQGSLALTVTQCDRVFVRGCYFTSQVGIDQSDVVFQWCGISAQNFSLPNVVQQGGHVQLVGSQVLGRPYAGASSGVGYTMNGGELRVLGGGSLGSSTIFGSPGFAIDGTGLVRIDPNVTIVGSATPFAPGITVATAAQAHVTTNDPLLGSPLFPSLHGPVGSLAVLAIGLPGPRQLAPGIVDAFWWSPPTVATLAVGIPQPGVPLSSTVPVPNQLVWVGIQILCQGVTFDATTGLQASNPVPFVVR